MFNWWYSVPVLVKYVISGVLLGVGFVAPQFWVLVFLGGFLFLEILSTSDSLRQAVLGGFITFTVKALFATAMFWSVYPLVWTELSFGRWEILIIGLYWLVVSLAIGVGGVLVATGIFLANKHLKTIIFLVTAPLWFVLGEILGATVFSIVTYGSGATINFAYSLGHVGYLLAEHAGLLKLAVFGGVYFLSAVTVVVFSLWWVMFRDGQKVDYIFWSVSFCLVVLWGSGFLYTTEPDKIETTKKVVIVDTTFGEEYYKQENQEEYKFIRVKEAVRSALALNPDYVILPEDTNLNFDNLTPDSAYSLFRFQFGDPEAIVVDSGSARLSKEQKTIVRAYIYDGINKTSWFADKQYLTPQGEFMPYAYTTILKLFNAETVLANVKKKSYYQAGPVISQSNFSDIIPAVLFCFESVNPLGVKKLVAERPNIPFVAHPFSHAWFHDSKILKHQLDTMLKVQAVWNGVSIVSAGNMGQGALYTRDGKKVLPEIIDSGDGWQVGVISL